MIVVVIREQFYYKYRSLIEFRELTLVDGKCEEVLHQWSPGVHEKGVS